MLASLALVYESVVLPPSPPTEIGEGTWLEIAPGARNKGLIIQSVVTRRVDTGRENPFHRWDQTHFELFNAGVLSRASERDISSVGWSIRDDVSFLRPLIEGCDCLSKTHSGAPFDVKFSVPSSMLAHGFREDIDAPAMFHVRQPSRDVRVLTAALAASAIPYVIPRVPDLTPQQILELRDRVSDTREGFLMHLQSLSKDVADGLGSDAPAEDVLRHANTVVQTSLIPDYVEFKRQLASQRAGVWALVAEAANDFFGVDAAPWTPKFWGAVLRIMGLKALTGAASNKDHLTNRAHAMTFLRSVERGS